MAAPAGAISGQSDTQRHLVCGGSTAMDFFVRLPSRNLSRLAQWTHFSPVAQPELFLTDRSFLGDFRAGRTCAGGGAATGRGRAGQGGAVLRPHPCPAPAPAPLLPA